MCLCPIVVKNSNDIPVPCGKCPECRARRVSAWSFRLMEEEKRSTSSYFLTLTYDNSHAQRLLSRNGFLSLEKRDLQLYFKRLRKAHEGKSASLPIKYYAVGEYGGKSWRPHYHILLFNAELKLIDPAWNQGSIFFGDVTGASVGYCLKYMSKPKRVPAHRNDDRVPEFSLMSKGLGSSYLTPNMIAWHKADLENRMYLNLKDGKKCSMPRYFKDRLYNESERKKVSEAALLRAIEKARDFESRTMDPAAAYRAGKAGVRAAIEKMISSPEKTKV